MENFHTFYVSKLNYKLKSNVYLLSLIAKIAGESNSHIICEKLVQQIPNIKYKSDYHIKSILYSLTNYIDNFNDSEYSILEKFSINELIDKYFLVLANYKFNYSYENYTETNKILLDFRINDDGFYWIIYPHHYSIEFAIRFDNCGRVNYGDSIIELRETSNNINYSHVGIAYNYEKETIYQIKGKEDKLPSSKYNNQIFDFFNNCNLPISKYVPQYKPENDFKLYMLSPIQRSILIKKYPNFFPTNII